eukprot:7190852-Pyramimonas_sp.AAC.1
MPSPCASKALSHRSGGKGFQEAGKARTHPLAGRRAGLELPLSGDMTPVSTNRNTGSHHCCGVLQKPQTPPLLARKRQGVLRDWPMLAA